MESFVGYIVGGANARDVDVYITHKQNCTMSQKTPD